MYPSLCNRYIVLNYCQQHFTYLSPYVYTLYLPIYPIYIHCTYLPYIYIYIYIHCTYLSTLYIYTLYLPIYPIYTLYLPTLYIYIHCTYLPYIYIYTLYLSIYPIYTYVFSLLIREVNGLLNLQKNNRLKEQVNQRSLLVCLCTDELYAPPTSEYVNLAYLARNCISCILYIVI